VIGISNATMEWPASAGAKSPPVGPSSTAP
jgi:hypothetical protein